jgi:hypothetical protein
MKSHLLNGLINETKSKMTWRNNKKTLFGAALNFE